MRLPWNSSVKRRSKSTRRGPSSDSPAGCSMEPPPKMPQAAGNQSKSRRFAPAQCRPYGESGLIYVQNGGMLYGYARVSTDGQSVDAQVRQLNEAGCQKV